MARESTDQTPPSKVVPKDVAVPADLRARARFLEAMKRLAGERTGDRALAELPELEMLEAATELTKRK
jgi:hypothetical protein